MWTAAFGGQRSRDFMKSSNIWNSWWQAVLQESRAPNFWFMKLMHVPHVTHMVQIHGNGMETLFLSTSRLTVRSVLTLRTDLDSSFFFYASDKVWISSSLPDWTVHTHNDVLNTAAYLQHRTFFQFMAHTDLKPNPAASQINPLNWQSKQTAKQQLPVSDWGYSSAPVNISSICILNS